MAYSHFQNGFANGVTIRGLPLQQVQPGEVFYVSNSTAIAKGGIAGSNGNKGSYQQPFATLDYAVGRCTAGRGDIILVMPGHAETISTATALALDVAGVAIIGLGVGTSRPTFTLDTATTTTIPVSANGITIANCIFTANFADIVSCFTLTTAKNFCLDGCSIKATATDMNFLNVVDTDATSNNCDGLTIINSRWVEPDLATLGLVKMDGSNINVVIENNDINVGVNNNKATIMAIAAGKVVTGATRVVNNRVYRLNTDTATGGLLITTDGSTNSGIIALNQCQHADTAAEILVTASSGFAFFDNKASGVAGASGYLLPAADS
jgi:hypothetical protein